MKLLVTQRTVSNIRIAGIGNLHLRNVLPFSYAKSAFEFLLNLVNGARDNVLARPDRAQLLLVANENIGNTIDSCRGLANEIATAQRIHRVTVRNQHVAGGVAIALLQDLGALDLRGILLCARCTVIGILAAIVFFSLYIIAERVAIGRPPPARKSC